MTQKHHCIKLKGKFLFDFIKAIPPPLGLMGQSEGEIKKRLLKMNIKAEDGWIYFNELLYRMLRNRYGSF